MACQRIRGTEQVLEEPLVLQEYGVQEVEFFSLRTMYKFSLNRFGELLIQRRCRKVFSGMTSNFSAY